MGFVVSVPFASLLHRVIHHFVAESSRANGAIVAGIFLGVKALEKLQIRIGVWTYWDDKDTEVRIDKKDLLKVGGIA